jgi:hypothetical protein
MIWNLRRRFRIYAQSSRKDNTDKCVDIVGEKVDYGSEN